MQNPLYQQHHSSQPFRSYHKHQTLAKTADNAAERTEQ
jgi:hypothetical protein